MTFIYIPPEPTVHESGATDRRGNLLSYTEKDLRSEVERVRRETEIAISNAAKMHCLSLIKTKSGYTLMKLGTAHAQIRGF